MSHATPITRRDLLGGLAAGALGSGLASRTRAQSADAARRPFELFTFSADVTPLVGHPCMGGGIAPVKSVADPLEAIGFVLRGGSLLRLVLLGRHW